VSTSGHLNVGTERILEHGGVVKHTLVGAVSLIRLCMQVTFGACRVSCPKWTRKLETKGAHSAQSGDLNTLEPQVISLYIDACAPLHSFPAYYCNCERSPHTVGSTRRCRRSIRLGDSGTRDLCRCDIHRKQTL